MFRPYSTVPDASENNINYYDNDNNAGPVAGKAVFHCAEHDTGHTQPEADMQRSGHNAGHAQPEADLQGAEHDAGHAQPEASLHAAGTATTDKSSICQLRGCCTPAKQRLNDCAHGRCQLRNV